MGRVGKTHGKLMMFLLFSSTLHLICVRRALAFPSISWRQHAFLFLSLHHPTRHLIFPCLPPICPQNNTSLLLLIHYTPPFFFWTFQPCYWTFHTPDIMSDSWCVIITFMLSKHTTVKSYLLTTPSSWQEKLLFNNPLFGRLWYN